MIYLSSPDMERWELALCKDHFPDHYLLPVPGLFLITNDVHLRVLDKLFEISDIMIRRMEALLGYELPYEYFQIDEVDHVWSTRLNSSLVGYCGAASEKGSFRTSSVWTGGAPCLTCQYLYWLEYDSHVERVLKKEGIAIDEKESRIRKNNKPNRARYWDTFIPNGD